MIPILNDQNLTAGEARYWRNPNLHARLRRANVTLIDPWRTPLKDLVPRYEGNIVYRASTGGRWGKSAEIKRL